MFHIASQLNLITVFYIQLLQKHACASAMSSSIYIFSMLLLTSVFNIFLKNYFSKELFFFNFHRLLLSFSSSFFNWFWIILSFLFAQCLWNLNSFASSQLSIKAQVFLNSTSLNFLQGFTVITLRLLFSVSQVLCNLRIAHTVWHYHTQPRLVYVY